MLDRKLYGMEEGLVRLDYSFNGNPQKEIGLVMSNSLGDCIGLANNVLDYEWFLRGGMKAAYPNKGMKVIGPFSGSEVREEYITGVEGRVIKLNEAFFDNFNPLLIPANSPYFYDAIEEMTRVLSKEGFHIENSTWEDYKSWAKEKIESF